MQELEQAQALALLQTQSGEGRRAVVRDPGCKDDGLILLHGQAYSPVLPEEPEETQAAFETSCPQLDKSESQPEPQLALATDVATLENRSAGLEPGTAEPGTMISACLDG